MKTGLIVILLALLLWFGSALARVENQRYALELEMCGRFDPAQPATLTKRANCLKTVGTRTSAFYNLAYGLGIL